MDELQLLRSKIRDYRDQLKDYLAAGSVKDYDGYQRIVGRLEAFNVVEEDLEEMVERHMEL